MKLIEKHAKNNVKWPVISECLACLPEYGDLKDLMSPIECLGDLDLSGGGLFPLLLCWRERGRASFLGVSDLINSGITRMSIIHLLDASILILNNLCLEMESLKDIVEHGICRDVFPASSIGRRGAFCGASRRGISNYEIWRLGSSLGISTGNGVEVWQSHWE
jgi:hypothetical protein